VNQLANTVLANNLSGVLAMITSKTVMDVKQSSFE